VVADSKGYANDRWPMKKKLMLACHGIKVQEV
jgi:NADH pyrophosphatase NudC (nudix superfamily)